MGQFVSLVIVCGEVHQGKTGNLKFSAQGALLILGLLTIF
jgi:hypothetical protein